jgi:choloylglycine hydrolase
MCTGIRLIAADGTVVIGRTLEFGQNILKFKKFSNRNIKGISTPDGKLLDGINQEGLVVFVFYFPKYAKYGSSHPDKMNVKPADLALMLLENANTVDDVVDMIQDINVIDEVYPPFKGTPPMHWMVTDASGNSVVIEPTGGGDLSVYDNIEGIFTNSPSFPEHIREANKVLKKTSSLSKPNAISQGTGAVGLPGDFSSVSRFIRVAFFKKNVVQPKKEADAVTTLIHILNNFDIPIGSVASVNAKTGSLDYETTLYTSYYTIPKRQLLYKDYNNQQIRIAA